MFAQIGKFFEKNLINPIRGATDKDFALRHEKTRLRSLEGQYATVRPAFFRAQEDFATAVAEYERTSEDFSKAHGKDAFGAIGGGRRPALVAVKGPDGVAGVLNAINDGSRHVLKTVTLGLTEAIYNIEEIPRERDQLNRQIKRLTGQIRVLSAATGELRAASAQYDAATKAIEQERARLGDDITASDVHVLTARAGAQKEIIETLIEQDIPANSIAEMTGIAPEIIAQVTNAAAADAQP